MNKDLVLVSLILNSWEVLEDRSYNMSYINNYNNQLRVLQEI